MATAGSSERSATGPETLLLSAADERFARCLAQLLLSVERSQPPGSLRVLVYDLGLSQRWRERIRQRFRYVELRRYDFACAAPWAGDRARALATYAWKPDIVRRVLREASGPLLWVDSASVFTRPLAPVMESIARTGLYTPWSGSGALASRTHPLTLERLAVPARVRSLRARAGGVIGVSAAHPEARALVERWASLAEDPTLLAPHGATLQNHRYDQSLWSIVVHTQSTVFPLTDDEIDISSRRPTSIYRVRNKVPALAPLWTDPLWRALFRMRRASDVGLLRFRHLITSAQHTT